MSTMHDYYHAQFSCVSRIEASREAHQKSSPHHLTAQCECIGSSQSPCLCVANQRRVRMHTSAMQWCASADCTADCCCCSRQDARSSIDQWATSPIPIRIHWRNDRWMRALVAVRPVQCHWVERNSACSRSATAASRRRWGTTDWEPTRATAYLSAPALRSFPCHALARRAPIRPVAHTPTVRSCVVLVAPTPPHHVRIRIRIGLCIGRAASAPAQVEQQTQHRCRRC